MASPVVPFERFRDERTPCLSGIGARNVSPVMATTRSPVFGPGRSTESTITLLPDDSVVDQDPQYAAKEKAADVSRPRYVLQR